MPGDALFDPPAFPPYLTQPRIVVGRYLTPTDQDGEPGQPGFLPLPNVRILSSQEREGPQPAVARYRIDFSDANPEFMPRRIEDVFGPSSWGYYRVIPDDRIVALMMYPDGSYEVLADGFAIAGQADAGDDGEQATFECASVPIREFDQPLPGAIVRHADKHSDSGFDEEASGEDKNANDIQTGRRIRFNPDGRPNAVPEDGESSYEMPEGWESEPWKYPVFLDPLMVRDPDVRRHWTLEMAARYIMATGNPEQRWTRLPVDFMETRNVLVDVKPVVEGGAIDHRDPDTYTIEDILVPDLDVTGLAWPDALQRLISPHGFAMQFVLGRDEEGLPYHRLIIYRHDANVSVKPIFLQKALPGQPISLALTNTTRVTFQQDNGELVNEVAIRSQLVRREISVVLAPLFEIDEDDALPENSKNFKKEQGKEFTLDGNSLKYRLYGVDETGDGHWDFVGEAFVTNEPPDLDELFRDVAEYVPGIPPNFARQRRPAVQRELFYRDGDKAVEAELWVAKLEDYEDTIPGPASLDMNALDGIWQKVSKGGWKLADDRLGIIITAPDPSSWSIGKPKPDPLGGDPPPFPSGKLNLVKSLADPEGQNVRFVFRLVCVVEGDFGLEDAVASRRPFSPTRFTIRKEEDADDRFRLLVRTPNSIYSNSRDPELVEDDTEDAKSYASGRRRAHEMGSFSGSATIPYITLAYAVGEKISGIVGRGIDFNGMAGEEAGEGRVYPTIVGIDRVYEPHPGTTLHLNDLRMEGVPTAQFNVAATRAGAKKAIGPAVMVSGDVGDDETQAE